VARIPYADVEKLHPQVRETFEALPSKLNIFRMLAHAERNFSGFLRLGGTILARQELDAKLRELAILAVASESGARYEWVQHVTIGLRAGVTEEQIEALEQKRFEADCFDELEQLVVRFTLEVVHDVRASDATFDALAARLSHREVVELVLTIGFYMLVARFLETFDVDLEPPADIGIGG
jgi:alkylhydroperoxidase family enzyme